jgi:hypothetical protein
MEIKKKLDWFFEFFFEIFHENAKCSGAFGEST